MKIAVYAISKNEEQFVERFCESVKDADYVVIADTGSTDNTVASAKKQGAMVFDICVKPWRFDKARDAALFLVPADTDICISLDLDEILVDGWREEIERVWKPETTRLRYKYDWGHNLQFFYEKIHHRHGYHWHHPCHEYPRPDSRIKEVYAQTDKLLVVHKPDPTKSRGQYLDLLELAIKEDPSCTRDAFYYARELTFHSKWNEAIEALKKYLDMEGATWEHERSYAMRILGNAYDAIGGDGLPWYRRACAELPNAREPWCELALACYRKRLWEECFAAASTALKITEKEAVYTADATCWGSKPHDMLAISAYSLGMKDLALKHGQIAVELDPNNVRLKTNLELYRK